ncbi:MAG: FG-GAP-like repeat-containing protein [Phycisphaerales bacterium]
MHKSVKGIVVVAGLAMAMPAFGQFAGFGDVLTKSTGVSGSVADVEGGDVNGDGLNDVVYTDTSGRVSYFAGFDDGVFDGARISIVEPDSDGRAIELVDYDRDGDLDLVRVAALNGGDLRAYRNDGAGDFEFDFALTGIGNVNTNAGLEFGDFDGDGDSDLYVLVQGGVVIIENTGGDFSRVPIIVDVPNFTALAMSVADLDGDGRDDAALLNDFDDTVVIARAQGGSLVEVDRFSPGTSLTDIKTMDMDADGDVDVLTANTGSPADRVSVFRNDGGGNFDFAYALSVNLPDELEVVDIEGDGDVDLIVESQPSVSSSERLIVFLNDGDGNFDRQADEWLFGSSSADRFEIIDIDPNTGPDFASMRGSVTSQNITIRLNQTPFFAPTAPALLTPANGASDLALPSQVAAWGGPVAPAVTWERAEGFGVSYTVVVSESPTLSSPVFEASGITARSADLSSADLRPGTTYYWSVFADNPRGSTGAASGPFSFTTAAAGEACRADFDGDGELTLFDFLAFSNAFDAGCP